MYRTELSDIHDAGVRTPYGVHHCIAVEPECDDVPLPPTAARPKRSPDLALMARYTTTTSAMPAATAAAAWRSTPWEPPPPYGTRLEKLISWIPRVRTSSVSPTGPTVELTSPSTSEVVSPASPRAATIASAASCVSLRPAAFENSVWPMPTIAVVSRSRLFIGLRLGLEDRDCAIMARGPKIDRHRHADRDVRRIDLDQVRQHPNALVEIDQGGQDRVLEGRVLWVMKDGIAVDDAISCQIHD